MNYAALEQTLEGLIRDHGAETVQSHLETLVGTARWSSWQSLQSLIRNVNNRLQREAQRKET
jgi:hypothetical protein